MPAIIGGMSPRHTAAEAARTRQAILDCAVELASVHGVGGVSAGDVAARTGLSRAGVIGPFGTMDELRLAVLGVASSVFAEQVWQPVSGLPAGLPRLAAAVEAWISYLGRRVFPGGCLMTTASIEFDALEGPVSDQARAMIEGWRTVLAADAEVAIRAGELDPSNDPDQIAFELYGIAMALNQAVVLLHDTAAPARARAAAARLLSNAPKPGPANRDPRGPN
jgi:AcrR family transcriptional regulator